MEYLAICCQSLVVDSAPKRYYESTTDVEVVVHA